MNSGVEKLRFYNEIVEPLYAFSAFGQEEARYVREVFEKIKVEVIRY